MFIFLLFTAPLSVVTSSDYKLLEQMNHVTTEKYKAMTDQATDLVLFMEELQKKCTIRRNAAGTTRKHALS